MPAFIKMPSLSPTMTEGKLSKWLKKKGDKISSGDVVAEIETDKATMEIEAVEDGILYEITVDEGTENIPVGSSLAIIKEDSDSNDDIIFNLNKNIEKVTQHSKAIEKKIDIDNPEINDTSNLDTSFDKKNRIRVSPLAKRLSLQNSIQLKDIKGSGPKGRIIKVDIENLINSKKTLNEDVTKVIISDKDNFYDKPNSSVRKVIAQRLLNSVNEAPHFFLSVDCNITKINELRKQINSDKLKISVNDFIVKASAKALKKVPKANCSWHDSFIRYYKNFDISVAVAIDDGLITPIVKNVESKGLEEISNEIKELAIKAKNGDLLPEEYQGGNLTVSNLGMFGVKNFTAILNPPQSMIIAIGKAEQKPIILNNKIVISEIMTVTLSCDHRVVDGALGAKWLDSFKSFIENPSLMLL